MRSGVLVKRWIHFEQRQAPSPCTNGQADAKARDSLRTITQHPEPMEPHAIDPAFFPTDLMRAIGFDAVLQTDPAIWPEQRLANEIAHRRARRYLAMEKELF